MPQPPIALRRRDAARAGLTAAALRTGVAEATWERVARGLYAPVERPPVPWLTLLEVQRFAPRVVFCLETALRFHDVTDVHPHAVWISIARGSRRPAIRWVRTEVVTVATNLWELGVETREVEGGALRVTGVARTVVDAFRFRRRIGLDIALAALRQARERKLVTPAELLTMARPFRLERTLIPYLQAVG